MKEGEYPPRYHWNAAELSMLNVCKSTAHNAT